MTTVFVDLQGCQQIVSSVRQLLFCGFGLENLQQDVVARSDDIVDPVVLENFIDSSFNLLGHLRSYMFDATELGPPTFHRRAEMLEHVLHAAVTTAQIGIHELPKDGPTQSGTMCH